LRVRKRFAETGVIQCDWCVIVIYTESGRVISHVRLSSGAERDIRVAQSNVNPRQKQIIKRINKYTKQIYNFLSFVFQKKTFSMY